MKLVAFTALLSILFTSSTVYLIRDQTQTELINLPGQSQQNDKCLTLFVKKADFAYIVYDLYTQNFCSKPKKFTILYQVFGGQTKTYITKCLYQFQDEAAQFYYEQPVLNYTEEDC